VGLPPAPRGVPQIEVTFDIDANGLVHVSAKDLGTGKEQSIRITAAGGLSEAEIKKMQAEAEEHRGEDEKRKELVNARNTLDGLVYTIEKTIKESSDKISAEAKTNVEAQIVEARKVLDSKDLAELTKATENLTQASNKMAEEMYKQAGAGAAGPGPEQQHANGNGAGGEGAPKSDKGDDAIDAEFKEV
jgi:molecular chaperone DnaK